MDLLDFNRFTGRVRLMKAGACTTYIKRRGKLVKMDLPSLPLGILNEAKLNTDDVTLCEDDRIVMVSDGVLTGSPDWIERLVLSWEDTSAEQLASQLVGEARRRRQGDHDDDITAIAMRVALNV